MTDALPPERIAEIVALRRNCRDADLRTLATEELGKAIDELVASHRALVAEVGRLRAAYGKRNEFVEKLYTQSTESQVRLEQALTAAEARAERLRAELEEYGAHYDGCSAMTSPLRKEACDCGFRAALAAEPARTGEEERRMAEPTKEQIALVTTLLPCLCERSFGPHHQESCPAVRREPIARAIAAAVERERAACAKIADQISEHDSRMEDESPCWTGSLAVARAIRARTGEGGAAT